MSNESDNELYIAFEHGAESRESEIESLRQRLADMTKERDKAKAIPMRYRRMEFNAQLQDENESLRQQLTDSQKREVMLLELANQCRIELVGQIHELADHIERARCCITDPDMLKQINGQREYAIKVSDKWNQNGNPFVALAATADLQDVILCHAEPVARKISYGSLVFLKGYAELPEGTPLCRAWEPK